jgi:hypothetical protein
VSQPSTLPKAGSARLSEQIVAEIIELVKSYQQGRATDIVADATINFTEGWIPGSDN